MNNIVYVENNRAQPVAGHDVYIAGFRAREAYANAASRCKCRGAMGTRANLERVNYANYSALGP